MTNTNIIYQGIAGTILDTYTDSPRGAADPLHRIALADGREAMLFASEIGHPLSWTCQCGTCATGRQTLGRAWA